MFVIFFVFSFLIHVLILFVVCTEFVGENHFDTRVGVSNIMFNSATKVSIIPWVHDSFIIVAYRGFFFDILIRVPSFSYNVIVGFVDKKKTITFCVSVGSMD
jgi:hypothetical protein